MWPRELRNRSRAAGEVPRFSVAFAVVVAVLGVIQILLQVV